MAERRVLVTVKIATDGRRCAGACPHLGTYFYVCRLLDKQLVLDEMLRPIRTDACLATDAAGDGS